jgi:hypothetical protein
VCSTTRNTCAWRTQGGCFKKKTNFIWPHAATLNEVRTATTTTIRTTASLPSANNFFSAFFSNCSPSSSWLVLMLFRFNPVSLWSKWLYSSTDSCLKIYLDQSCEILRMLYEHIVITGSGCHPFLPPLEITFHKRLFGGKINIYSTSFSIRTRRRHQTLFEMRWRYILFTIDTVSHSILRQKFAPTLHILLYWDG